VFDLLSHNRHTDSLVAKLKLGPVSLATAIEPKLKMPHLTTDFAEQSPHFLLSLMYYHGMVTYGDAPEPGSLQIPNALARSQFLDRLDKMFKQYTAKFLRTLNPADLQPALKALLDGMGPMDDKFNEGYVKAFLMGLLSPYADDLVLTNEPEVDDGNQRSDLLLTTDDGREVIIEFKTLMPHQLAMPGIDHDKNTTHFWSQDVKRAAHQIMSERPRTQLLRLPLRKPYGNIKSAGEYFNSGKRQIQRYGARFLEEKQQVNAGLVVGAIKPPKLLLVSSFWNTHLVIEEVPFAAQPNKKS